MNTSMAVAVSIITNTSMAVAVNIITNMNMAVVVDIITNMNMAVAVDMTTNMGTQRFLIGTSFCGSDWGRCCFWRQYCGRRIYCGRDSFWRLILYSGMTFYCGLLKILPVDRSLMKIS